MTESIDNVIPDVTDWHTLTEAETILGKSRRTIQRRISTGEIESKIIDGVRYVKVNLMSQEVSQSELVEQLKAEIEYLKAELERRNQHIEQQNVIMLRTVQENQYLLEYHRESRWRRWFARGRGDSSG